jgi:hydrogenase maturation protease
MHIAVLGIGNILMGDDAFGPYVVKTFDAQYRVTPNIDVIEIGTPGLDLVPHLTGYEAVIIVDTVRAKAEPGTVRVYTKDEILEHAPQQRTNTHDPALKDTLLLMQLSGSCPEEITLIGAVPETIETATGLSAALLAAVPEAVAHVEVQLAMLGFPPAPRNEPLTPDIWWEKVGA